MHGNQRAMIANQLEQLQQLVERLQTARNQLTHITDSIEGQVGPIADPIADLVAVPTDLLNTTRDWHADFTGPAGDMVTSLRELTANGRVVQSELARRLGSRRYRHRGRYSQRLPGQRRFRGGHLPAPARLCRSQP